MAGTLTWLGHGAFRLDSPGGKRIYIDPWLANPKCPESEKQPERMDIVAITHGHNDHLGGVPELAKQFSPKVVAIVELADWLDEQGGHSGHHEQERGAVGAGRVREGRAGDEHERKRACQHGFHVRREPE